MTLPSIGTWTVCASIDTYINQTDVNIASITFQSVSIPVSIPFASATDAQIAAIVSQLDAGLITTADTGWKVGDTRDVSLASFRVPANTGTGYEIQAAQVAQLVIQNIGGKTFSGNNSSLDGTECHFVVGFKDNVCKSYWSKDVSVYKYASSTLKTVENSVYDALPSNIKSIFKKFSIVTGVPAQKASDGSTSTSTQFFTSPAEKEIFGVKQYSDEKEANALSQFQYYSTARNRIHSNNWWERSPNSPRSPDAVQYEYACLVLADGSASSAPLKGGFSTGFIEGISPYGCI